MTPDPRLVEPAIFWYWNDDPTADSIRRRLDAFLSRGIRTVYVHPMPDDFRPADFHGGMRIPYLSPDFFDWIVFVCAQVKQRGMWLGLYDEGGWPSGRAGGLITREDPGLAMQALEWVDGRFRAATFPEQPDYPDLMNPRATQRFIELTHERYRQAVGHEFGRTILSIFTDEPRLLGLVGTSKIPWSAGLPVAFEHQHGYALKDVAALLFKPAHGDRTIQRVHSDFQRTVSRLIRDNYYRPIARWCKQHGLLFEGHHSGEDGFARHGEYFGNYLEQAAEYHLPGIDTIWRQIFPGESRGNFVSLASSSAWLRGGRVATAEVFGVYGPGLTLAQMHWIGSFLTVRGVNRHGLMASLESDRGPRRVGVCSDFSPSDPRWADLDLYIRQSRNANRFTLRGVVDTPVAVFYRIEQLTGDAAEAFDASHEAITSAILDRQHPLLFVGESDLGTAQARGVRQLIVHAAAPLTPTEIAALRQAEAQGVEVCHVNKPAELRLPRPVVLHLLGRHRGLRTLILRNDHGQSELMCFNESGQSLEVAFDWHAQPLAEHLLEDDPTIDLRPLRHHDGVCRLSLAAGEIRAFQAAEAWVSPPRWRIMESDELRGGWKMRAVQRMIIDEHARLVDVDEPYREVSADELLAHAPFSGTALLQNRLTVEVTPSFRYVLQLDEVCDACEVCLDGQSVGRRAWGPWQFDLTEALLRGARDLTIRVTNTGAAAWIASSKQATGANDWKNWYWSKLEPWVRESQRIGIAGPMKLLSLAPQNLDGISSNESQILCHPR